MKPLLPVSLLIAALLGACSSPPMAPDLGAATQVRSVEQMPQLGATTPEPPLSADASSINTPAPAPDSGLYAFEAERAAMAAGCQGPGRSRPASVLRARREGTEWFEVRCQPTPAVPASLLKLRCDHGMCQVYR